MSRNLIIAFFACGAATASAAALNLKPSDLTGTWRCGPTVMQGPGFTVTVTDETTKLLDGTYTGQTQTVISAPGQPDLTLHDISSCKWQLDGDVVRTHVLRDEFVSASDPTVTKAQGQKALDDQLAKKAIYESRVLELKAGRSRSIPVNSMYKEAVVESSCQRI